MEYRSSTTGTLSAGVEGTVDIAVGGYSRVTLVIRNTGGSNAIGTNAVLFSADGTNFSAFTTIGTAIGSIAANGTSLVEIGNLAAKTLRVSMTSSSGSTYSVEWYCEEGQITGATEALVAGSPASTSTAGSLSVTTLAVSGATTLNGAVTLGDAAADDVTFSGVVAGNVSLKKEGAHTIAVAASTTADTAGGALTIKGGDGGATNANGGALTLDGGALAGTGTGGAVSLGATNAESVTIGRTGKTTTIPGALAVTQTLAVTGTTTAAAINASAACAISIDDATANASTVCATLRHTTSGTADANIGAGLLFASEDASGNAESVAQIDGILTTATHTSEASAVVVKTRTGGGALTEAFRVDGSGNATAVGDLAAAGGFRQSIGPFYVTTAADQTAVGTKLGDTVAMTWVAPRAGSVTAASGMLSAAITGSGTTIKARVYKNGSLLNAALDLDFTEAGGEVKDYATVAKDTYTFAAGDEIDVVYTSTTITNTPALAVFVEVEC